MIRILIDMNLSPRWARILHEAGFQAEHWTEIGPFAATDREIMRYAADHDAIVLTADLDFSAILAATDAARPSVVQLRADTLSPEELSEQVMSALKQCADELTRGALVTIDIDRRRIRLLPLINKE